jgi:hypothetical protein
LEINVKLNNSQVKPTATVLINLSGGGQGGNKRISVSDNVTLAELGVDLSGQSAKPEFPQEGINEVNASGMSADQKSAKIQGILNQYEAAAKTYAASGGMTIQDKIVLATVDYLVKKHGFSTKDEAGKPYIKPSELQVTAVPVNNELMFSVVGTSVWG